MTISFDYTIDGDCEKDVWKFQFNNASRNVSRYLWDFGDGTFSDEVNPVKIYPKAGKYTVTLTGFSDFDSRSKSQQVNVARNSDGKGPTVSLGATQDDTQCLEYNISLEMEGAGFMLDFGDGTPAFEASSEIKPIHHRYPGPGTFTIFVSAYGEEGGNCAEVQIIIDPLIGC
jgi:PKD repeat protein